ncbi:uncharacterized protein N7500_004655 [Penicillium coprophilum]|uniref:uncharacterized protein n=1 Tax=Penicillium coprophilum TaxID=36646 RepID=UPI0023914336|nr:uncharacterized protein N7500_004655 [Penicillium coprophilum]KAJ5162825.1 hypothetical protein N7500_004655 [Penicillium coprophilum]
MPTQPSKSDEPRDYPETCLLCGIRILRLRTGVLGKDRLDVLKESQWEIHHQSPIPEHILLPSTEVVNKNFSKFPWLSSCYHRGARKQLKVKEKSKLSDMRVLQNMN